MPVDRVLIEIMTQANMAGVTKAQAGFAGLIGNVAGATVVLGGLFEVSKDMIAISEEHSRAENNLAGAIKSRGQNVRQVQLSLQDFMHTNRDFINNQSEVINSYAALTREGVKGADLSAVMTTALHIQAAEGGTLAEAVLKIQQAEVGRNRGLATAVGLQLEAIKGSDTLAEKHAKVERNLKRVAAAYKDVKLTPLQVASNHLATSWEHLAETDGPALVAAETTMVNYATDHLIPSFEQTSGAVDDIGSAMDRLIAHPSWQQLWQVLFGQSGPILVPGGPLDRLWQWSNRNLPGGYNSPIHPGAGSPTNLQLNPAPPGGAGSPQNLLQQIANNTAPPTGQTPVAAALYKANQLAAVNRNRGMSGAI